MQFKLFKTRRITLREAKKKDFENYKKQLRVYRTEEDKLNILDDEKVHYIAIEDEAERMIGLIQVDEIDQNTAHMKISVPNVSWRARYGKEAVHQFLKCCEEQKLCKRLYLKQSNHIVKEYMEERPETLKKGAYIDFAVA